MKKKDALYEIPARPAGSFIPIFFFSLPLTMQPMWHGWLYSLRRFLYIYTHTTVRRLLGRLDRHREKQGDVPYYIGLNLFFHPARCCHWIFLEIRHRFYWLRDCIFYVYDFLLFKKKRHKEVDRIWWFVSWRKFEASECICAKRDFFALLLRI